MSRCFVFALLLLLPATAKPRLPQVHVSSTSDLKQLIPQRPPVVELEPRPGNEPPDRYEMQPWPDRWFFYGAGWSPLFPSDPRLPQLHDPFWGPPMLTPGDVPYRL